MPVLESISRWSVRFRWFAMLVTSIGIVAVYTLYRPALAQENSNQEAAPSKNTGQLLTNDEIKKKAAADMAETAPEKPDKKDAVAAGGEAATLDIIRDIKWLSPHMWAVYAIALVSLVSLTFAAERALALRRSKVLPYDLALALRTLAARKGDIDIAQAQRLCRQYPSALASVVKAMIAKAGRPVVEIESALKEACEREASRLFANVRWQNLAFNVAPMFGLAGTVHGMIIAFYVTAHMPLGKNKMESLATGIYAALVCTFAGLIVAIPAGIFSHYFEGRILKLFQEIEDLGRMLMPQFERLEGRVSHPHMTGRSGSESSGPVRHDLLEENPMPIIAPKK